MPFPTLMGIVMCCAAWLPAQHITIPLHVRNRTATTPPPATSAGGVAPLNAPRRGGWEGSAPKKTPKVWGPQAVPYVEGYSNVLRGVAPRGSRYRAAPATNAPKQERRNSAPGGKPRRAAHYYTH